MSKEKWTPERVAEIQRWIRENDSNKLQASKHFKVPYGAMSQAVLKYEKAKAQIEKQSRKLMKKTPKAEPITLNIPDEPQNVAVIVMPLKNLKSFIGACGSS